VRILGGSFIGREERVAKVSRRTFSVTLDNATSKTGERKQTPLPIRTGHLVIVRLNLSDPYRRRILRVTEAELTPEERGEPVEPPAVEGSALATSGEPSTPASPVGEDEKKDDEAFGDDDLGDDEEDEDEDGDVDDDKVADDSEVPEPAPEESK
jgi:hypothetical protein